MSVLFNMKNKETLLSRIDIKVDIKCQCCCLNHHFYFKFELLLAHDYIIHQKRT